MQIDDGVLVGVVLGPHGVRGLLKVKSLSDNPARFVIGRQVFIRRPEARKLKPAEFSKTNLLPLVIEGVTTHQGKLLIAFAGIENREQAAQLVGAELIGEPDETKLAEGQYYHYQLIGLTVFEGGECIGKITEVLSRPANDIYVMENEFGEEIWIPALKTVVKSINLQDRCMEVELPEGLTDN